MVEAIEQAPLERDFQQLGEGDVARPLWLRYGAARLEDVVCAERHVGLTRIQRFIAISAATCAEWCHASWRPSGLGNRTGHKKMTPARLMHVCIVDMTYSPGISRAMSGRTKYVSRSSLSWMVATASRKDAYGCTRMMYTPF